MMMPAYRPPPNERVYREWHTPVKDLRPAWRYYSRAAEMWLTCHGPAEVAWRVDRGESVELVGEMHWLNAWPWALGLMDNENTFLRRNRQ